MKKISKLALAQLLLISVACGSSNSNSTENTSNPSVTLLTHDSFAVSEGLFDLFTAKTGISVEQLSMGDTGQLISTAILTKNDPLGDVVFGIDNTFLSRAVNAEILQPVEFSPGNEVKTELIYEESPYLTPIDFGHVCVNFWKDYFSEDLPPPETFDDLLDPINSDMLVVQNPETSSPGLAFLLSTISFYGENWTDFWQGLKENNISVTSDWESSYYGDFIAGGGKKPLVVSYASSPIAELIYSDPKVEVSPTGIIKDTCFKQVEYAGILKGAENYSEAIQLIDFLISSDFQNDIPLNMFMMPVSSDASIPDEFLDYPVIKNEKLPISALQIDENRNSWTDLWTEIVLR